MGDGSIFRRLRLELFICRLEGFIVGAEDGKDDFTESAGVFGDDFLEEHGHMDRWTSKGATTEGGEDENIVPLLRGNIEEEAEFRFQDFYVGSLSDTALVICQQRFPQTGHRNTIQALRNSIEGIIHGCTPTVELHTRTIGCVDGGSGIVATVEELVVVAAAEKLLFLCMDTVLHTAAWLEL